MHRSRSAPFLLLVMLGWTRSASAAQDVPPMPSSMYSAPAPGTTTTQVAYNVSAMYQNLFPSDLESGGSAASDRFAFNAGLDWRPDAPFTAGVQLDYEWQGWDFQQASAFGSFPPWDALERGSVSLPAMLAVSPEVVAGFAPFTEWAFMREAGSSNGFTYGATFSAFGIFSRRLRLGAGVKVHHQFFSTTSTPFLIVDWKINEKVRVTDSQIAGLLGVGGLELRYAPAPRWELSVGGVQRFDRFRLASVGPGSGDIAEPSGIPVYGRVSYGLGMWVRTDLYAGMVTASRLRRWDSDGLALVDEDVAAVPMVTIAVESNW